MAAAGTTSAFLTVGVTGAGSGHSLFSPAWNPPRNPEASGIFSQLSLRPCPETRWLVTPTRGLLGEGEGFHAALYVPALGHPGGPLRHGPKEGQHKAMRPPEAPPAGSPRTQRVLLSPRSQSLPLPPVPRKDNVFPRLGTWKSLKEPH